MSGLGWESPNLHQMCISVPLKVADFLKVPLSCFIISDRLSHRVCIHKHIYGTFTQSPASSYQGGWAADVDNYFGSPVSTSNPVSPSALTAEKLHEVTQV